MEPRPQSSRPAQEHAASHRAAAPPDASAAQHGSYQQPDPTTIVAPPRADYDYSPLDLAPPGQRRRRQLVAAVLGGLVMMLLVAAVVFAYLLLRDEGDSDDDNGNNLAAAQTEVAHSRATVSAQETLVAAAAGTEESSEPETDASTETGDNTTATEPGGVQSTAGDAAGQAIDATEDASADADAATGSGPLSLDELRALLPDASVMPQGLDQVTNTTRSAQEVIDALGGSRDAETRLRNWGWSGNVEREFQAAEGAGLPPDATTDITISLHGFASEEAASEALTFYSDILVSSGYEEAEAGDVGTNNRLLTQQQGDGGTVVALYVQEGSVLYRIGGYSPAGDPSTNVLNVARELMGP